MRKLFLGGLIVVGILFPVTFVPAGTSEPASRLPPIQVPDQTRDITLSTGTPGRGGDVLADPVSGVQLYREAVEAGDLVGAVLLVAKDGKVVLHEAVGWRHKGRELPMETNTMFRMASNTKPTIGTAISQLVEEGKLAYDDPVRKHIPSFDNYRSGFIQIRHLLNHTAGFRIESLFLEPYMEPSPEHPDAPTLPTGGSSLRGGGGRGPTGNILLLLEPWL